MREGVGIRKYMRKKREGRDTSHKSKQFIYIFTYLHGTFIRSSAFTI
jgi:hypothetical protein